MPVYDDTGAQVSGTAAGGGIPSAKGGLLTHDGAEQTELAVGASNGQRLTVKSAADDGIDWQNDLITPIVYASVSNSTSKTAMATVSVPQSVLSTNKSAILRVILRVDNGTGSSRTLQPDIEFGSTNIATGTLTIGSNADALLDFFIAVQNDGAVDSQTTGVIICQAGQDGNAALAKAASSTIATGPTNRGTSNSVYDSAAEDTSAGALDLKLSITLGFADASYYAEVVAAYAIIPI